MAEDTPCFIGVLTIADHEHDTEHDYDHVKRGGEKVMEYMATHFDGHLTLVDEGVPNSLQKITERVQYLSKSCCLVLTVGGIGPGSCDMVPEATVAACDRIMPGFGEVMRAKAIENTPLAMVSRQTAGVCGEALVINLPTSPDEIPGSLDAVLPAIPHAMKLAGSTADLKIKPEFHVKGTEE